MHANGCINRLESKTSSKVRFYLFLLMNKTFNTYYAMVRFRIKALQSRKMVNTQFGENRTVKFVAVCRTRII